MEFCFDVNPDLDLAIGAELTTEEAVEEFYSDDTVIADVNPMTPTEAKPGSASKVQMLAARYAAGIPLWHDEDCYDHGPARDGELHDDGAGEFDEDDV